MWSIIKDKLRMLIILMVVLELNTGTETDNDWFSQYGERRDAGEDVLETGIGEGEVGGGILKQKEACQHLYDNYLLLFVLCGDCYNFVSTSHDYHWAKSVNSNRDDNSNSKHKGYDVNSGMGGIDYDWA